MTKAKFSKTAINSKFAVVMGDIIDSEQHRSGGALSHEFNSSVRATNRKYHTSIASPLTITLGDEFQGLVRKMTKGFEIIVKLRSDLLERGVNCRFVLGIVRLDTKVNTKNAWNMMGDGLAQARDKLNDKRDRNVYRFSIYDDPSRQLLFDAIGLSLTTIEEGWTPTQRHYVQLQKELDSVNDVASRLGVGSRSVYKVLEAANWTYYQHQEKAILSALSRLDEEYEMA
jgi:hypothetical protein